MSMYQGVKMDTEKSERLTMTVGEAGKVLGISRATAYMLAKTGGIPVIHLGMRRLVVPKIAIERMLNGMKDGMTDAKQAGS